MQFTIVEINKLSQALQVFVYIDGIAERISFYIPAEELFGHTIAGRTLESVLREKIQTYVAFLQVDYKIYLNASFDLYQPEFTVQDKQQAFG